MPRIKSGDKHSALLDAAVTVFAERGVWTTPTSAISRAAGVAEGTLFTYFPTKAALVNELYRVLKGELAVFMLADYPHHAPPRERLRHIWDRYVAWGVDHPAKLKVMGQLKVSDQVSDDSRAAGMAPFAALEQMARDCIASGLIRDQPVEFIGALLGAMAEMTMVFVAGAAAAAAQPDAPPGSAIDYCAAGFDTFWQGIAVHPTVSP